MAAKTLAIDKHNIHNVAPTFATTLQVDTRARKMFRRNGDNIWLHIPMYAEIDMTRANSRRS